jgi:hypothetical protein
MAENDPNRERRTLSSAEILALADRLVARANSKMMEDTPSQRADSVLAAAALRLLATEHFYDGVILDECKRDIVPSLSRNL